LHNLECKLIISQMNTKRHCNTTLGRTRFFIIIMLILGLFTQITVSCSNQNNLDLPKDNSGILKISVFKSGEIQANGAIVNLTTLEGLINNIASNNGSIWYYRESAQTTPPPQAMEVMKLIVKYKCPVSMSSKPDFSDYIDGNGNSIPRPK
jgi:hypothetical protein